MVTICLVIPYFGKLPDYFNLWLESVKYNSDINFLIFADDKTKYEYPENVTVNYVTFKEIKDRIQKLYDFKINLKKPYKLCDFRPAFGEIFAEELKIYDFWGYCDIDLIFGDIRKFVTDDILNEYDKINLHGHFSLFKNNEKMRTLYKVKRKELVEYDYVFRRDWSYHFDEYPGISYICEYEGIKTIAIEEYADIGWLTHKFVKRYAHASRADDSDDIKQIFHWNSGKIVDIIKYNNSVIQEEYMYVHLQKRNMKNTIDSIKNEYFIVPNEFIQDDFEDVVNNIEKYCKNDECEQVEKFRRECFWNRFKIEYWIMKIKMAHKKW